MVSLTPTAADEFDLADALNPNNDPGGKNSNKKQGGGWRSLLSDRLIHYICTLYTVLRLFLLPLYTLHMVLLE